MQMMTGAMIAAIPYGFPGPLPAPMYQQARPTTPPVTVPAMRMMKEYVKSDMNMVRAVYEVVSTPISEVLVVILACAIIRPQSPFSL